METEYLDTVNKELLEIEHFFQNLYASSALPPPYTPRILPLLQPVTPHPSACPESSSSSSSPFLHSLHSGRASTLGSEAASVPEVELDHLVTDLRARYKQLKVVQDRLHIELTKLHVWKQQQQSRQIHPHHQDPTNKKKCPEQQQPLPSPDPSGQAPTSSHRTTRSSNRRCGSRATWITLFVALAGTMYIVYCFSVPSYTMSSTPIEEVHHNCQRPHHHRHRYDSYPWPRH